MEWIRNIVSGTQHTLFEMEMYRMRVIIVIFLRAAVSIFLLSEEMVLRAMYSADVLNSLFSIISPEHLEEKQTNLQNKFSIREFFMHSFIPAGVVCSANGDNSIGAVVVEGIILTEALAVVGTILLSFPSNQTMFSIQSRYAETRVKTPGFLEPHPRPSEVNPITSYKHEGFPIVFIKGAPPNPFKE